ncbi:hypothetical protein IC235_11305 [Hymenobacter sp. BT664]|uniref:Uncharacterized protein n=1 Tax=Hymenobacter montanus TaxID=2771359 RepID=A0A927GJU5_9BACT|nr:hypothetical protein [Hymenobacter montanus]MBD2768476.1 hypothetical protein [Hymenobacter montanus]
MATYYADTVRRAVRGHLAKCTGNLTPALYRQLTPGRAVYLHGAAYRLDAVNSYDLADEANQTEIQLLREV